LWRVTLLPAFTRAGRCRNGCDSEDHKAQAAM
jgi:hypothetical protein